jgi:integrase
MTMRICIRRVLNVIVFFDFVFSGRQVYLPVMPKLPTGVNQQPNGRYRARYRDADGRQLSRSFDTAREAARWRTDQMAAVNRGDHVAPDDKTTVLDYAMQWAEGRPHRELSRVQMRTYLNHLRDTPLGTMQLRHVRTSDVQAWVRSRSDLLAPQTVRNLCTWLRAVFSAAVEDRLIAFTPFTSRVALPTLEKEEIVPLTVDQVEALSTAMPERYRMMVILQAALGLRISELLALKVSDIDWLRRTVKIERQLAKDGRRFVPPKTKESFRTIPLAQDVALRLSAHIKQFPPNEDGVIFTTLRGGNPVRYNHYGPIIFDAARQAAGMPETTTHDLRHHFASELLSRGVPVNVVARFMGHASAKLVLETYGHLMPNADDVTRKALDAAWRRDGTPGVTQERVADS